MKKFNKLVILASMVLATSVNAQRYLKPMFDVNPAKTITYGKNYTVLSVPTLGKTTLQPLLADVYTPKGDAETKRPLVIYFHSSNILKTLDHILADGSRSDSTSVTICKRFAALGYVAVSVDYRLGWNPFATSQQNRAKSFINAIYRGVQDGRTAVRFFKENASTYGVDTSKIMVFGQGAGGYITLGMSSLDKYSELLTTTNPAKKFIGENDLPFVIEKTPNPTGGEIWVNSDIEGKNLGLVPPGVSIPPKSGDTLCFPNWVNQSSKFSMAVNLGGVVGDISWIDAVSNPVISIQCPYDLFTPYKSAVLSVNLSTSLGLPTFEVQGAYEVSKKLNALKINDVFKGAKAFDPYGPVAAKRNDGYEGLFPLFGTSSIYDSSPWDFWAATNPNNATGLQTNKNMSAAKANKYIDTIVGYVAPRACLQMNLPCKSNVLAIDNITDSEVALAVAPNPTTTEVRFTTDAASPIKELYVYDINGRMIRVQAAINSNEYTMNRGELTNGIYLVQLRFEKGYITKRVIFE